MAKNIETIVTLTDDLDGSKADRTVTFAYEGTTYEIDLSRKNANALDKALAQYVGAARKVAATNRRSRNASGRKSRNDLANVRQWARGNGYEVADRGRIPANVIEAYQASQ